MQTALRKMGNSTGMILPKPILVELGVESGTSMEVVVENGRVIATPVKKRNVHEGWEEAAKRIGAEPLTDDEEAWLGFDDDIEEWTW
jgi:antitoxin MazE